jgi:hypothetical protein
VAFVAALALGRLTVIAARDNRVAAPAGRRQRMSAAQALRGRFARPCPPAASPAGEPQPEPAGSDTTHR